MFHSRLPAAGYLTYVCEMEETNMKKKILKIIAAAAAVTVSYTHLDVYKRQVYDTYTKTKYVYINSMYRCRR